jgi:hypothetical protein
VYKSSTWSEVRKEQHPKGPSSPERFFQRLNAARREEDRSPSPTARKFGDKGGAYPSPIRRVGEGSPTRRVGEETASPERGGQELSPRTKANRAVAQKRQMERLMSTNKPGGIPNECYAFTCSDGVTKMPYNIMGKLQLEVTRVNFIVSPAGMPA